MDETRTYRIGTVARMTGFSIDVLRAWERRYALLRPGRGPGGQRIYSDEDLAVLGEVARRLGAGHSIGEVARAGREALLEASAARPPGGPSARSFLDIVERRIVEAAVALDGDRIRDLLEEASRVVPPASVIARVIEPAAHAIGEAWASGACSVAGEHLATSLFTRCVQGMLRARSTPEPAGAPGVLVACLPDDLHELPALIVTFHLERMGFHVTCLGPSLPFEDLDAAIRTLRPRSVYLSVSRRAVLESHKPRLLELLRRQGPDVEFVVGGQGLREGDEDLERAGALLWPDARPAHDLERRLVAPVPGTERPS